MNILHLNSNYDNSLIHRNIVAEMNNIEGVSGKVFHPIMRGEKKTERDELLFSPPIKSKLDKFTFYRRNRKYRDVIYHNLKLEEYDLLFAHSLFSNGFLARTIAQERNMKFVVLVTNTDMNLYFKKMTYLRKIGIDILLNAQTVFFSSQAYVDELFKKYVPKEYEMEIKKKIKVIPFGIDNFWLENNETKEERPSKDNCHLLYVGKINKNKNIQLVLKACDELVNRNYNINFTVIGNPTDGYGKQLIDRFNEVDYLTYHPYMGESELLKAYRENHIFVMTSFKESFGLVYGEAMSQGLPVLYTSGQGFDQQFPEGMVGYSVNSNSSQDLVNKIERVLSNYEEQSRNATDYSNKFEWRKIVLAFLYEFDLERRD